MTEISYLSNYRYELEKWMSDLVDERDCLSHDLDRIQLEYPTWKSSSIYDSLDPSDHDSRPEYFMLLSVILQNVWLSFMHARDRLCSREYWSQIEPKFRSEKDIIRATEGYLTMLRQYSITQTVSITENTLASIATCGSPPFKLTASTGFENAYKHVLSKISSTQDMLDRFEIVRLVRNAQHTNGRYLPKSGEDVTKRYQGKEYFFEVGRPINWDNGDMIKSCFHSMHSAMWDIINSPQVSRISFVPN